MSLRYFGNELYKRGPNTVIAFSWRDCARFLFVGDWITHCVPYLGCFLVFILCPMSHQYFVPYAVLFGSPLIIRTCCIQVSVVRGSGRWSSIVVIVLLYTSLNCQRGGKVVLWSWSSYCCIHTNFNPPIITYKMDVLNYSHFTGASN